MNKPNLAERIKARMKVGETRTITSIMKGFRASREDVEDCVGDTTGLDLIVGMQIGGGGGHGSYKRTDYEIERYE